MIDVHIIIFKSKINFLEKCLKQLETNKNINIYFINGYFGNIGLGRYEGFSKGTSDLVAFVDPDDYTEPKIFDKIIEFIKSQDLKDFCGIYTHERKIDIRDNHISYGRSFNRKWKKFDIHSSWIPHHLCIMKREYVNLYLEEIKNWKYRSEYLLKNLISLHGDWILYPEVGYNWRIHENNTHKNKTTSIFTKMASSFLRHIFQEKNYEKGKCSWLSNPKNYEWYTTHIDPFAKPK